MHLLAYVLLWLYSTEQWHIWVSTFSLFSNALPFQWYTGSHLLFLWKVTCSQFLTFWCHLSSPLSIQSSHTDLFHTKQLLHPSSWQLPVHSNSTHLASIYEYIISFLNDTVLLWHLLCLSSQRFRGSQVSLCKMLAWILIFQEAVCLVLTIELNEKAQKTVIQEA